MLDLKASYADTSSNKLSTLCFHNPEYAKEQYKLSGSIQGSSIYKYS